MSRRYSIDSPTAKKKTPDQINEVSRGAYVGYLHRHRPTHYTDSIQIFDIDHRSGCTPAEVASSDMATVAAYVDGFEYLIMAQLDMTTIII